MSSKESEDICITEADEETDALQKKRSRRVSFAENTSVHVYERDEDSENSTPQSHQPGSAVSRITNDSAITVDSEENSLHEFEGNDADAYVKEKSSFLRPRLSSSPGSTIGSASSNDEDSFFGPVSASFIRSGRLSGSGTSDKNLDITMDSREFSLHFHSLAKSEVSGDVRTPAAVVQSVFLEKSPIENKPSDRTGTSMVLTGYKKPILFSPSDKSVDTGDSIDMSLIDVSPHKYDFEKISPELRAIMANEYRKLFPLSIGNEANVSQQSKILERGSDAKNLGTGFIDSSNCVHVGPDNNSMYDTSLKSSSTADTSMCEPNNYFVDQIYTTPRTGTPLGEHSSKVGGYISSLSKKSAVENDIFFQADSISMLCSKRTKMFLDTSVSSECASKVTSLEQSFLGANKHKRQCVTGSSVEQNTSKIRKSVVSIAETTDSDCTPNVESRPLNFLYGSPSDTLLFGKNNINYPSTQLASIPISYSERLVSTVGQKRNKLVGGDSSETPRPAELIQTDLVNDTESLVPALGHSSTDKAVCLPNECVSSPMETMFPVSLGFRGSPDDLQQQENIDKPISFASVQCENFVNSVPNATASAVVVDKFDFLPFKEIYNRNAVVQANKINDCPTSTFDLQDESRASQNFQYLRMYSNNDSFKLENPGKDMLTGIVPARFDEICLRISEGFRRIHSPLIGKLNLQLMSKMKDIVDHLHNVKMFDLLSQKYQPQKLSDPSTNETWRRIMENKFAVYRMAYEESKYQLLCLERDLLLERKNFWRAGAEKSRILNLKFSDYMSAAGASSSQSNDTYQLQCDKTSAMKQELEASSRKMMTSIKYFQTHWGMKEEQNCADVIAFINDHMNRRIRYRFLRDDLLPWTVDNFECKSGHYILNLSYHGLVSQRLSVNAGHVIVTNKLHEENILKNFPNVDALTAYSFVLNADPAWKYAGPRTFAKVTQRTGIVLSNLLHVMDEVRWAKLELRNLICARFHSSTGGKLDVEFRFVDYANGREAVMRVDMSCLSCGVYPSDVFPLEILIGAGTSEQSLSTQIGKLSVGYGRIGRLCRCVSDTINPFQFP